MPWYEVVYMCSWMCVCVISIVCSTSEGEQRPEENNINDTKIKLDGNKYIPFREKAKRDCD